MTRSGPRFSHVSMARLVLLVLVAPLAGCVDLMIPINIDPSASIAVLQGDSVTVTVTAGESECVPTPQRPCVDINYGIRSVPIAHSFDYSLRSPSTSSVARLTFNAAANAESGIYSGVIHAFAGARKVGSSALTLRLLPTTSRLAATAAPATIAAGDNHSLALLTDGTVWAWGRNESIDLGNGSGQSLAAPAPVPRLRNVRAIATAGFHSLALLADGTVWQWERDNALPVQVPGLRNVQAIATGIIVSLALLNDGTVWQWADQTAPIPVADLFSVQAIAAGRHHFLALLADGTIRAWGNNDDGQLGNGSTVISSSTPVQVLNLNNVQAIAAGASHSLALLTDGTAMAWGTSTHGQLGTDPPIRHSFPAPVLDLNGVQAIAAGASHSLALLADGTVWAWGDNDDGRLGNGSTVISSSTPVQVLNLRNVRAIAAGASHSLALLDCGAQAWGNNAYGQLGDGTRTERRIAQPVLGLGQPGACGQVALSVAIAGSGVGTVTSDSGGIDCDGPSCSNDIAVFDLGSVVTLTATTAPDSQFARWGGDCQSSTPQFGLTLDTHKHCTAVFRSTAPELFLLTVNRSGGGLVTSSAGGILGPDHIDCGNMCNAIFAESTAVTLSASDSNGFGFIDWGGVCSSSNRNINVIMDSNTVCAANFRAFALSVATVGAGTVTSNPAGIHCGSVCSASLQREAVSLFAAPALGWQFDGWGGDCQGAATQATVGMDADKACTARFSRIPDVFLLRTFTPSGGMVSNPAGIDCGPTCVALFPAGTSVTLTVFPAPDLTVRDWFGDCPTAPFSLTNQVTMDSDRQCGVNFTASQSPIANFTFLSGPRVGQVVQFDGSASFVLNRDTGSQNPNGIRELAWDFEDDGAFEVTGDRSQALIVQSVFQTPGGHPVRLRVRGGNTGPNGTEGVATEVQSVGVLEAAAPLFGLSVARIGDGAVATDPPGLIACGPGCVSAGPVLLEAGTLVTLSATPGPKALFSGWSGDCAGASPSVQVSMSSARHCIATFIPSAFALTVSRIGNGRVSSNPAGIDCGTDCGDNYPDGTSVTLTATPDPGWRFDGWGLDCAGTGLSTQVTVDRDKTCRATFSQLSGPFTLTVNKVGGAVTNGIFATQPPAAINCGPVCAASFPAGTTVRLVPADAASTGNFTGWSGCDVIDDFVACFVTLNSDRAVTATFR